MQGASSSDATSIAEHSPNQIEDTVSIDDIEAQEWQDRLYKTLLTASLGMMLTIAWLRHTGALPVADLPPEETFTEDAILFCEILDQPGHLIEHFLTVPVLTGTTFTDGTPIRHALQMPLTREMVALVSQTDAEELLPVAVRYGDTVAFLLADSSEGRQANTDLEAEMLLWSVTTTDGIPEKEIAQSLDLAKGKSSDYPDILIWSLPL